VSFDVDPFGRFQRAERERRRLIGDVIAIDAGREESAQRLRPIVH